MFGFELAVSLIDGHRLAGQGNEPSLARATVELKRAFADILKSWHCTLLEFGAEPDHIHMLVGIHPALKISTLINNLKSASSRRIRNRFAHHLKRFYRQPYLWHRAYYVGSAGNASLATVRRYVSAQSPRKK